MATILLQAAGSALGGVFGPVGAIIGRAAGALAGSVVDRALIGGSTISGARLATARIPGADEGTAVIRLYGTARIGGTLIWATRFEEDVSVERSGGKASGSRVETFQYFANFAMGLCEGPIARVRRVWADGREIDLTEIEMRVHTGGETQMPDPLIEAKQGTGLAPAYQGLAYVVFERLPLDPFGNRIPLLQFEVVRPIGRLETQIRAVTLIPGATEHGYRTNVVTEATGAGSARAMNRNVLTGTTDWEVSLDELTSLCPNLERVALVVSWFGTDLRAGHCRIVPGVEVSSRDSESSPWSVSGIARGAAHVISRSNGGPAFGGTPDDVSVLSAIADLKARGLKVYLYPFLMMDIPAENTLPDPYGGSSQPPYPWRGRVTCHPAAGQIGTVDRTVTAAAQVRAFSGTTTISDFAIVDGRVVYGGEDNGYRRLVLHYAHLAIAAGGVDGFILGSELRGLTQIRDDADAFPFVSALLDLASDVRAVLGNGPKLTYGADWSEYFGFHPDDGSGNVYFNLDPLWASSAIDAVGIDNYMPLADWRDDDLAAVNPDGLHLADDLAGMTAAITSGEGYDWYYASTGDRRDRIRTPITDGLAGKPWVYRYKDIAGWWSNEHRERIAGMERSTATAWIPGGKPIWFTELGCPAIDKGGNQPNVFSDPKSAESAVPYFSSRARSDSMQRRFLEAHHDWWGGSEVTAGMVDPAHIFAWTWDARPFPAFPEDTGIWSDGDNWRVGHWLNGRLGSGTLADVFAALLRDHGFMEFDVSQVGGDLGGYVQGEVTSARSLLDPLLDAFQIDVIEDGPVLRFRSRTKASLPAHLISVLADLEDEPLWQETRGHDSDFAAEAIVTFYNPELDYEQASTRSRRAASATNRILRSDLAAVLPEETALLAAESLLRDNRIARRSVSLALGPSDIGVQPGDVLSLASGPQGAFLVSRIEDGQVRRIEAREFAPSAGGYSLGAGIAKQPSTSPSNLFAPIVYLMDLPRFEAGEGASFARAAVFARPWHTVGLSSSATTDGYRARSALERPAQTGRLVASLPAGVSGRFDWSRSIELDLYYGGLSSAPAVSVLNGANRIAVLGNGGEWEIIAFCEAQEMAAGRWQLSGLLRGLAGSEDAMTAGAVSGAAVVVLDQAVKPLGLTSDEAGLRLNWLAESAASSGRSGPFVFEGGVRAETPLAPVHLRGKRNTDGTVALSWTRRGRIDADDWMAADIPLDEVDERYRLEILDGDDVLRQVDIRQSSWIYAVEDETSDFGVSQAHLRIRVRQIGRKVPLGLTADAVIQL